MLRLAAFPTSGSETWRSVILLMQLRWIAVIGQLITIVSVKQFLHVHLPLAALLIAPLLLILVNLGSASVIRRRRAFSQAELFVALMIDVVALCWQLYHSGGATNPFTFLFLLQIVIGAVILEPRWSWLVALNTCLCMVLLTFQYVPLELPAPHSDNPFRLYIFGSLFCFLLAAVLLVFFVVRLDRNRRESDKALAALRQQAAEEDHIIRMGLLASGAAHELGTPLSSMSVILGDWAHLPEIKANGELGEDLSDMRVELERCKTIVTGILMSAGEMRGENPSISTVHTLFGEIVEEWQSRMDGELRFVNRFGEDATIVADPGLRQVIGNVIDNAQEVSPDLVIFEIARESDNIVIAVSDIGPGFSKEMLARVGQPYSSTKGRDGGGLGLFLVVNVVRKLGGRVIVENREMGGATVRLILPLAALAYDKDNQA
ncbi:MULTISPECIES: ATP-binding protein [unclassified Novosphingobium]|uniref:ATP-binding protein n=1 Tax=unclassified Novosphingobium TaxID=2644732 RepID=UPI00020EECBD|nr:MULTISPECIES: ATP-binding protein [unclassified Novosphingobium]GFM30062.1 histidine kinase [Novosphingobium sp. PY1]CCA92667.1 histidine kinase [Novosphingobium sp. PP1Y]